MKACILRKVIYRPSDSDKLTWGLVLSQNAGLALLFVPRRSDQADHAIAIASENIEERLFEPVQGPQFPMEDWDLGRIGKKLLSLGNAISEPKLSIGRICSAGDGKDGVHKRKITHLRVQILHVGQSYMEPGKWVFPVVGARKSGGPDVQNS